MKKLKPPKGFRMLKPKEILNEDDRFFQPPKYNLSCLKDTIGRNAAWCAEKYGYTSCYIRKISKPKKSKPKKSLGQIAYDTYRLGVGCDWQLQSDCVRKDWKAVADAVAREVRRRMASK